MSRLSCTPALALASCMLVHGNRAGVCCSRHGRRRVTNGTIDSAPAALRTLRAPWIRSLKLIGQFISLFFSCNKLALVDFNTSVERELGAWDRATSIGTAGGHQPPRSRPRGQKPKMFASCHTAISPHTPQPHFTRRFHDVAFCLRGQAWIWAGPPNYTSIYGPANGSLSSFSAFSFVFSFFLCCSNARTHAD